MIWVLFLRGDRTLQHRCENLLLVLPWKGWHSLVSKKKKNTSLESNKGIHIQTHCGDLRNYPSTSCGSHAAAVTPGSIVKDSWFCLPLIYFVTLGFEAANWLFQSRTKQWPASQRECYNRLVKPISVGAILGFLLHKKIPTSTINSCKGHSKMTMLQITRTWGVPFGKSFKCIFANTD